MNYEQVMAAIEETRQQRAEKMPTEKDAILVMFEAYQRLKELGWHDGAYMPTTGKRFAGIQNGSTGIHAFYGRFTETTIPRKIFEVNDGDIWPSYVPPVLYREWSEDDVQPNLRICAPIPDEDRHDPIQTPPPAQGQAPALA